MSNPLASSGAPVVIDDAPGIPGLVSVVIPAYNRAALLPEAVESVLAQTYASVEVIVADDGSTDDTAAVAAGFGDRIRLVRQANGGLPSARNLGMRHARGEFIAFLDSDDSWLPWKLAVQVALLARHPEVGVVGSDMSAVTDDGALVEERYLRRMYGAFRWVRPEVHFRRVAAAGVLAPVPAAYAEAPCYVADAFDAMFLGNLLHPSTQVFRRAVVREVGGLDSSYRSCGEDYEFSYRVAAVAPIAIVDAPTMRYRIGSADQMTAPTSAWRFASGNLRVVEHWLEAAPGRLSLPRAMVRRRLAESHHWLACEAMDVGRYDEARRHFARTLRMRPFQPATLVRAMSCLLPPRAIGRLRDVRHAMWSRRTAV